MEAELDLFYNPEIRSYFCVNTDCSTVHIHCCAGYLSLILQVNVCKNVFVLKFNHNKDVILMIH